MNPPCDSNQPAAAAAFCRKKRWPATDTQRDGTLCVPSLWCFIANEKGKERPHLIQATDNNLFRLGRVIQKKNERNIQKVSQYLGGIT